ncbi:MAG: Ger(x)C family spore germination C-terminal domain-containing protein [Oscillospiraceae bacterium]
MRKMILLLLCPLLLCACSDTIDRTDIEDTVLIRVFGIDKTDSGYKATVLFDDTKGGKDAEPKYKSVDAEGVTVFQSFEKVNQKLEKKVTLAQTKFIILGKSVAEDGIAPVLAYAARNQSIKLDTLVYTLKDKEAGEFLSDSTENDSFLGDSLLSMHQKEMQTMNGMDNTVGAIAEKTANKVKDFTVPCLTEEDKRVFIDGCSVFEDMKQCDTVDYDTYTGIELLMGKVKLLPLYLEDGTGIYITDISSSLKVKVENGQVNVEQETGFATSLKELPADGANETEYNSDDVVKMQNEYVMRLMNLPIEYSKKTGRDIMGLQFVITSKDPKGWETVKDKWDEVIPQINYTLKTKSLVSKAIDMER